MSGKGKTILLIIIFALFIAGSILAYNMLSASTPTDVHVGTVQKSPDPSSAPAENTQNPAGSAEPEASDKIKAPDFTVTDIDGNEIKLSDFEGKPVVLNFWASWCSPCKIEMPEFDLVWQEIGDEVEFMMVDLVDGYQETVQTGSKYITDQGFSFPVYYDTLAEAAYAYGIRAIPTTLFIDKDGYAVSASQGTISEDILRENIDLIK